MKRPNILFLMSDEHRADVAGYEGDSVVRTPVLDELARTGVVFSNAYTPSPICVPGRQCMMAGQHARTCGCEVYGEDLAPGYVTFAWPKQFPGERVVRENVSLCDLFATFCELADIPVPPGLDSRSLVPLLRGDMGEWDNEVISQFGRTNVMIKSDHLKYQHYGPNMPEVLFDLERNPEETVNYIDHPAYAGQVAAFRERFAELGYGPSRGEE